MPSPKVEKAKRKEAWAETKAAVGAYAKHPCEATEKEVKAALGKVKHLCTPCPPAQVKPKSKKS